MTDELKEKLINLFCTWCPQDCDVTQEEKLGCLAAGGFVDELLPETKAGQGLMEKAAEALRVIDNSRIKAGLELEKYANQIDVECGTAIGHLFRKFSEPEFRYEYVEYYGEE